jgi:hypothetical protein
MLLNVFKCKIILKRWNEGNKKEGKRKQKEENTSKLKIRQWV